MIKNKEEKMERVLKIIYTWSTFRNGRTVTMDEIAIKAAEGLGRDDLVDKLKNN